MSKSGKRMEKGIRRKSSKKLFNNLRKTSRKEPFMKVCEQKQGTSVESTQ